MTGHGKPDGKPKSARSAPRQSRVVSSVWMRTRLRRVAKWTKRAARTATFRPGPALSGQQAPKHRVYCTSSASCLQPLQLNDNFTPTPPTIAEGRVTMDPPTFFPQSPGVPLFPLSPERVNGTRPPYGQDTKPSLTIDPRMSQSPSLPSLPSWSPEKMSHGRSGSEVQGMVARFNNLEINDHAELRRRDEIALRKAEMGWEQAELRMEKLREELRRMQKEAAEGRDRERRMAKRIESLTVSIPSFFGRQPISCTRK